MPEEEFQPSRLRLARELHELSQAQLAAKVGLSAASISQFESGANRPSEQTWSSLAIALETPSEFLARPMSETHEGFFRSLRRTRVSHRRRARALAHLAHDLAEDVGGSWLADVDVPSIPISDLEAPSERIAAAAKEVRAQWNVPAGPVENMVELLEQHGVVVIRLSMDNADVDAFSLPFEDRPVVVLASDKNDKARSRFDAAHELGHLVMHGRQVWGVKEVERQAHMFAAEFLMPEAEIRAELPSRADWAVFFSLKQKWQVSLAALVMRAKDLGRMSPADYLTAVKAMSARGWRRVEPVPLGAPEVPARALELLKRMDHSAPSWLPDHVAEDLVKATSE